MHLFMIQYTPGVLWRVLTVLLGVPMLPTHANWQNAPIPHMRTAASFGQQSWPPSPRKPLKGKLCVYSPEDQGSEHRTLWPQRVQTPHTLEGLTLVYWDEDLRLAESRRMFVPLGTMAETGWKCHLLTQNGMKSIHSLPHYPVLKKPKVSTSSLIF